jgi:hypothetical protein
MLGLARSGQPAFDNSIRRTTAHSFVSKTAQCLFGVLALAVAAAERSLAMCLSLHHSHDTRVV